MTARRRLFTVKPSLPFLLPHKITSPSALVHKGDLSVHIAESLKEIKAAQALRYHIFYQNMSAKPHLIQKLARRDFDRYDRHCIHLILTTNEPDPSLPYACHLPDGRAVIGCYRLFHKQVSKKSVSFYSAHEFDLTPLLEKQEQGLNIIELGRSCVAPAYRTKKSIDLLWKGLGEIVAAHKIDALMGCASFEGRNPAAYAQALSYLNAYCLAPEDWRVKARARDYQSMALLPEAEIDRKAALKQMPPLLKGYLRCGCMVGDGAVIDKQFGTIDVHILMLMTMLDGKYKAKFAKDNIQ